jgi:hypothetical protein
VADHLRHGERDLEALTDAALERLGPYRQGAYALAASVRAETQALGHELPRRGYGHAAAR